MFKKLKNKIESKRNSSRTMWRTLILLKDFFWDLYVELTKRTTFYYSFKDYKRIKRINLNNVNHKYKISFCISCMGRLNHIKKTLKTNILNNKDYKNVEFLLLDYNSQDGLKKWVFQNLRKYIKDGTLVYYQTREPKEFHMSNAKNIAHILASGDVVCNLDADNYTGKHFAKYINYACNKNKGIIGCFKDYTNQALGFNESGWGGRIFMFKEDFEKLGGYDEGFDGWGHEDNDFYNRAIKFGLKRSFIPICFLKAIKHSDEVRIKNMSNVKLQLNNTDFVEYNNKKNRIILKNNIKIPKDIKRIYG
ncbi:glycosyltransferase [Candidatus Woesearchaeota archaeon]|nr:glycosyltransferase [Candidatus Woesearchaeota archaeon]